AYRVSALNKSGESAVTNSRMHPIWGWVSPWAVHIERAELQCWNETMKRLGPINTRRQLLRVMAAGAVRVMAAGTVSVPFFASGTNSASARNCKSKKSACCLLKGTKISTPLGDRLVQELQIGDEVHTLTGRKTIKWIGYKRFTKEEGRAWQDSVMPIRVARFAIDDHTPHCDLYLSPWHCIFLNQALIPVMYLINEATIAQGTPSDMQP